MPVPWEALIPFGLTIFMFGATGSMLKAARMITNDGKPPRYNLDAWDQQMMQRDERLSGKYRGQSDNAIAEDAFSTNSRWGTERIS